MKTSANHSVKHDDNRGKSKSPHEASAHAQDRNEGQPAYKRQTLQVLSPSSLQAYKPIEIFTPLKLCINEVFNTIKDQPWVKRSGPIQYTVQGIGRVVSDSTA